MADCYLKIKLHREVKKILERRPEHYRHCWEDVWALIQSKRVGETPFYFIIHFDPDLTIDRVEAVMEYSEKELASYYLNWKDEERDLGEIRLQLDDCLKRIINGIDPKAWEVATPFVIIMEHRDSESGEIEILCPPDLAFGVLYQENMYICHLVPGIPHDQDIRLIVDGMNKVAEHLVK